MLGENFALNGPPPTPSKESARYSYRERLGDYEQEWTFAAYWQLQEFLREHEAKKRQYERQLRCG